MILQFYDDMIPGTKLKQSDMDGLTGIEFLKKVFNTTGTGGMSLKQYPRNSEIYIWMVRFDGILENWKNRTVKIDGQNYIREKYVGTDEYVEDVAKEKLGLVYPNEIIFEAEK